MREVLSLSSLKNLVYLTGSLAAICFALSLPVLVFQVRDQDRELDCRAHDAVVTDVLRSEISVELSRGLVALVEDDDATLNQVIIRLDGLQADLVEAAQRRESTVERCN